MLNRAFFKRIIPFVVTFAFGLLIASFFVNIAPNFRTYKKKRPPCRGREAQTLRYENERLRWENEQLRQRLEVAPKVVEMPLDEAPQSR